jgi:radical SAM superfamily enzyme YgiQ (UPF0313 family)
MLIYLGDVYHTSGKPSTPTPTNIGFIASYCKEKFGDKVDIKLFKNPHKLIKEIEKNPPDVLGLSNYMWNETLNKHVMEIAKKKNDKLITVTGGPNLRSDKKSIELFLKTNKEYDFCILYAAEVPFFNLIKKIFELKFNKLKVKDDFIQGCFSINSGEKLVGEIYLSGEKDLDYVPSPFLNGMMDDFLNEGYYPLFETNRGCPFSCTFCVWGISALHKIKTFTMKRVVEEFDYVSKNSMKSKYWFLADANFGILPRDVEIAKKIRNIYDSNESFEQINIYWTKNITDRTYEIAKTFGKLCQAYTALQSLDPLVLKLIKRNNISVERLNHFKNEVADYTNGTYTDILLGQPGETKESHINSVFGAMKLGFDQIGGGEVRLLPGSEMDEEKSRKDYEILTKFRMGEGAIGVYKDKPVFELEEVVRGTKWISEDEMTSLRSIRALIYVSTTLGELNSLNTIMVNENINIFKVVENIIENRQRDTEFSKMLDQLDKLAKDEWFVSRKSATDYYYKLLKTNTPDEVSPVKLNMWVLVKFLKSKDVYNQFLKEFKKSILEISNNLDETIIDDMLKISGSQNYLRSCLDGDFKIDKEISVNSLTIDKLKEVKILSKDYNENYISLSMEKKLSRTIISTLPSVDTADLSFSQYIQDYGINMQMKILNPKTPFIVENKTNTISDFA